MDVQIYLDIHLTYKFIIIIIIISSLLVKVDFIMLRMT